MMCSIEELGSTSEMYPEAPESGIYILPEDAAVGADAVEVLGLRDVVFEYEITSNRVDCYSVIGIAREAAATFGKEFHPPVVTQTGNGEDMHRLCEGASEGYGSLSPILRQSGKEYQDSLRHRSGCRDVWQPAASVPSTTWWISPTM